MPVYRVLRVVLAVFALGVLGCEHAASPGAVAPAVSDAAPIDVFWKAFREAYPIHAQGVAFSEPSGDGTRTLVVAEPPPDVTAAAIASVDGSICDVGVRSHALGEDGWTKDLVAHVRGAVDVAMLNEKLARLLFGTAYGSYVLPVPAPAPLRDLQEPQVDMGDVRGWVNDSRNKLVDVIDGSRFSPKDLVHRANGGVYWSDPAGLVAWALPRGEVDDLQAQFRMFAVDSDLVLGAYASKSNVVILGRRRVLPIATYAPLRFESFCALTNTGDLELAQSFERGNPLSGKLPDGAKQGWDWAPIYLSPGVLDTEVGGVLNIADQLLKSLSNHGETTYDGFLYPSPPAYPFEQSVVSKTGATSITYNWNTRGFATLLDTGAVEYLNFGDTTALPITFLVADETTGGDESEDTGSALGDLAREKFAKSGDPYLIRATEYAALYQIVFNFDLESEETDAPGQPTEQTQQTDQSTNQDLAATYVRKAVDWLATASDKALEGVARKEIARWYAQPAPTGNKPDVGEKVAHLTEALRAVREALRQFSPAAKDSFAKNLSAADADSDDETIVLVRQLLMLIVDKDAMRTDLAKRAAQRDSVWIRTPSWVGSKNPNKLQAIGGHDIDPSPFRVIVRGDIPSGGGHLVENGMELNPADLPQSPSGALLKAAHLDATTNQLLAAPVARQISAGTARRIVVDRRGAAFMVSLQDSDGSMVASWPAASPAQAQDLVEAASVKHVQSVRSLEFRNMEPQAREAFVDSLDLRSDVSGHIWIDETGAPFDLEGLARRVRIEDASVEKVTYEAREGGTEVTADIRLPSREANKSGVLLRFKQWFRSMVPEKAAKIFQTIQDSVASTVTRWCGGQEPDLAGLARDMRVNLRKVTKTKATRLRVHVRDEARSGYLVDVGTGTAPRGGT